MANRYKRWYEDGVFYEYDRRYHATSSQSQKHGSRMVFETRYYANKFIMENLVGYDWIIKEDDGEFTICRVQEMLWSDLVSDEKWIEKHPEDA